MVKKAEPVLGPGGRSFDEQDDFVLNYRPSIDYVEPDQVTVEPPAPPTEPTLDDTKNQASKIVDSLNQVATLADALQQRIDQRVMSGGGVSIKLDPTKDQAVIAAMKRRFPDKTDPTTITYEDYRNALNCLQNQALPAPAISAADIMGAKSDPLRTDFGGLSNQAGENRPEISSPGNGVKAFDASAFQKAAVLALFAMMLPLISAQITSQTGGL
jgi:hypothetical protein